MTETLPSPVTETAPRPWPEHPAPAGNTRPVASPSTPGRSWPRAHRRRAERIDAKLARTVIGRLRQVEAMTGADREALASLLGVDADCDAVAVALLEGVAPNTAPIRDVLALADSAGDGITNMVHALGLWGDEETPSARFRGAWALLAAHTDLSKAAPKVPLRAAEALARAAAALTDRQRGDIARPLTHLRGRG